MTEADSQLEREAGGWLYTEQGQRVRNGNSQWIQLNPVHKPSGEYPFQRKEGR